MALLCLDEHFVVPKFFNLISKVGDNLLFHDKSALPTVLRPRHSTAPSSRNAFMQREIRASTAATAEASVMRNTMLPLNSETMNNWRNTTGCPDSKAWARFCETDRRRRLLWLPYDGSSLDCDFLARSNFIEFNLRDLTRSI